mmetsp:Transcript_8949/g.19511  ORF Transcript_8949/g.19511 Transcript_8949/m.19511 type:complete len:221 (+) Transcript_8949:1439-2101(+)
MLCSRSRDAISCLFAVARSVSSEGKGEESTCSSSPSAFALKKVSMNSAAERSSRGSDVDMSSCDMMASARIAAVRVWSSSDWRSWRMGARAPSARRASRKAATAERLPRTAAAAPCTSALVALSSEVSERCQPDDMKMTASEASTPRLATHCTADDCTRSSGWSSSSAIRRIAPASRSASRFDSERERAITASAACAKIGVQPLSSIATSGWIVMRSMLQ